MRVQYCNLLTQSYSSIVVELKDWPKPGDFGRATQKKYRVGGWVCFDGANEQSVVWAKERRKV